MSIYLFDFDLTGADSIAHLIDAGLVTRIACDSFDGFERALIPLMPRIIPEDLIVIDTFTSAVDTTRVSAKLGDDLAASIWSKRGLYTGGDKNYQTVYNYATDAMMLRIRNIAALNNSKTHVVILAHEDQERDPLTLTLKRGPQANPAAVKTLIRCSTDIMRLTVQTEDEVNEDGSIKRAAGARILYLKNTDEHICKVHTAMDVSRKLPAGIMNPTMSKIRKVLNKNPSILTIYGAAGSGKTTLATSDAQEQYDEQHAQQSVTNVPETTSTKSKKKAEQAA